MTAHDDGTETMRRCCCFALLHAVVTYNSRPGNSIGVF